jgi:MORN repeat variant
MEVIDQLNKKYPSSEGYVFRSYDEHWVMVLKKLNYIDGYKLQKIFNSDIIGIIGKFLPQTITDESRPNIINPECAQYRADKLLIVDIVHKYNPKMELTVVLEDIEFKVSASSITQQYLYHVDYFKNPAVPLYYRTVGHPKNGAYKKWYKNGQLIEECTYKDGELDGLCRRWYENGQLKEECTYKRGFQNGLGRLWEQNGRLVKEHTKYYNIILSDLDDDDDILTELF